MFFRHLFSLWFVSKINGGNISVEAVKPKCATVSQTAKNTLRPSGRAGEYFALLNENRTNHVCFNEDLWWHTNDFLFFIFQTGSLFFWYVQSLSSQSIAQKQTKKQRLFLRILGWISCLLPHQPPFCSGHVCRLITSIGAAKDSNSSVKRKQHGSYAFTPCAERGSPASQYQHSISVYIFFLLAFFSKFQIFLHLFPASLRLCLFTLKSYAYVTAQLKQCDQTIIQKVKHQRMQTNPSKVGEGIDIFSLSLSLWQMLSRTHLLAMQIEVLVGVFLAHWESKSWRGHHMHSLFPCRRRWEALWDCSCD